MAPFLVTLLVLVAVSLHFWHQWALVGDVGVECVMYTWECLSPADADQKSPGTLTLPKPPLILSCVL